MKTEINLENWERKEHFEWFKDFNEPFWGIVSEIDCTEAYEQAKELTIPFYHVYLHKSLKAINHTDGFRLRIENDKVYSYDTIHASVTLNNKDKLYSMSFIQYNEDLQQFSENAKEEEERIRKISGLGVNANTMRNDVIHYSSVPWFKFSGLTHARNYKFNDSVPKITFGKFEEIEEKKIMSIALNGHHGLIDGYHAGQYLKLLQQLMHA